MIAKKAPAKKAPVKKAAPPAPPQPPAPPAPPQPPRLATHAKPEKTEKPEEPEGQITWNGSDNDAVGTCGNQTFFLTKESKDGYRLVHKSDVDAIRLRRGLYPTPEAAKRAAEGLLGFRL